MKPLLMLASAATLVALLPVKGRGADAEVSAPKMIEAFEGTFGAHAGQRR